jgi:hypothetical protein
MSNSQQSYAEMNKISFPEEEIQPLKDSPSHAVPQGNHLKAKDDYGQSKFQDIQAVESHNSKSSGWQPQKPSFSGEVEAIATSYTLNGAELGNACGDDLLAPQVAGTQLEHNLMEQAETVSSLKQPEITVSMSKAFTNHLLVKCETPAFPRQERNQEMDEIEHFLEGDYRFCGFTHEVVKHHPGPERDTWLFNWYRKVYQRHNSKEDQVLVIEKCNIMSRYLQLWDYQQTDVKGRMEDIRRFEAEWNAHFYDRVRKCFVYMSYVPYNLGQCERTSGPSHVEEGGGAAVQRSSQDMDRSSPEQDQAFPRQGGPSQC